MINVFVYGTLMRERSNHYLLENEKYIGKGILRDYQIYDVNDNYPGIVYEKAAIIQGELYSINEHSLKMLDELECEGYLYIRKKETIELDCYKVEAYVYVWNRALSNSKRTLKQPWSPISGVR